jgi:amino acid transporter
MSRTTKPSGLFEVLGYVAISVGMALSASNYSVLAELLSQTTIFSFFSALAVAGVLCCVVSSAIGELASAFPSAPGVRTYLRGALGDRFSLWATYSLLLATMLFAAIETEVLGATLQLLMPGVPVLAVIVLSIAIPVTLNCIGLEVPRLVQDVLCIALVFGTLFAASATLVHHHDVPAPAVLAPNANWDTWVPLVGTCVFLYMGFEWVTPLGRSPQSYRFRIPIAMLCALLVLSLIYVLTGLAFTTGLGAADQNPIAPHVAIAGKAYGNVGRWCAGFLSVAATVTTFNAGILGASRLVYALSREGALPRAMSRVSERNGTPYAAILTMGSGALCVSLAAHATNSALAAALACAAIYGVIYALLAFAALLQRGRAKAGGFRSPLPGWVLAVSGAAIGLFGISAPLGTPGVRLGATLDLIGALLLGALGAGLVRRPVRTTLVRAEARTP